MIAIKNIEEMSKSCCEFHKDTRMLLHCPFYNSCDKRTTIKVNFKPIDCPLVEIVTCKDCIKGRRERSNSKKYCMWTGRITEDDFYCKDGKRRE